MGLGIDPAALGLPARGRRRVRGLRREELAALAGVSVDYYTRLEQDRDRHPSPTVIDALARVLQLDDDTRRYLQRLADPPPRSCSTAEVSGVVRPGLLTLIASWTEQAALVLNGYLDVLAVNALASALCPGYRVGENVLRWFFLDPIAREFFDDWLDIAPRPVAALRASAGTNLDDPRLAQIVGELSAQSDAFSDHWNRHEVRDKTAGRWNRIKHPLVGSMTLSYEAFTINGSDGQSLVVHFAEPGSPDEQALKTLVRCASADQRARPV